MDYSKLDGLIPAVIQDAESSEVLMVGFMNEEALAETRRTGFATFFSRTRNKLWMKGETSGNRLEVVEILIDCDDDTVLREGEAARRRQRLPHRRAHLLLPNADPTRRTPWTRRSNAVLQVCSFVSLVSFVLNRR